MIAVTRRKNAQSADYNKPLSLFGSVFVLLCFVLAENTWAEQLCRENHSPATTPTNLFEISDHSVKDSRTGLIWQRCFLGASGKSCNKSEARELTWAAALQAVEAQNQNGGFDGYSDWRIPNIRELQTISELQCVEPALNPVLFPNAPAGRTWSSSPYKFYPHYSWYVDFKYFEVSYLERYNPYFVILVRDSKTR